MNSVALFLAKLLNALCITRDTSLFRGLVRSIRTRHDPLWIALTVDIEPRVTFCEFYRGKEIASGLAFPVIVLSTHVVRRFQTSIKLSILITFANLMKRRIGFLSTDGWAGVKIFVRPRRGVLVTQWFNSPDEADDYWVRNSRSIKRICRIEYFPERPGFIDPPSRGGVTRLSRSFVFARPSELHEHFPTHRTILFASDITVSLRPAALSYVKRFDGLFNSKFDLDRELWEVAKSRVGDSACNDPFDADRWLESREFDPPSLKALMMTEIEHDGLRLTLHGRERYLYVKKIAESNISDSLVLIGQSWREFKTLEPFVSQVDRFPSSLNIHHLQRSRVCPDFGSSLGSMPQYLRAQILAARSVGLLQRSDPKGNPLLDGLLDVRTFGTGDQLIAKCEELLILSDQVILKHASIIRENYEKLRKESISEFTRCALSSLAQTQRVKLNCL